MAGLRRRRRDRDEDSDVQEGLLEEEREAEGAERADLQAAASGSEPASTGPAQLTTLESFILFITKGLAACATSLQACVQWIVTGSSSLPLTDEQLELVAKVRAVLKERFDRNNPEHQAALRSLWEACFPGEAFSETPNPRWTDAGFQGPNPANDFRGGGFQSLLNLLYMAEHYPEVFHQLMHKTKGMRADFEYPFSVAGINITFRLEQLLQFRAQNGAIIEHPPQIPATAGFLKLLEAEPFAFEELYVATFQVLDREWLASKASCMQFAGVLTDAIEEVLAALVSRPGSIAHFRERLGLGPRARLR